MFEFDETTPQDLRDQILAYHMTELLTDGERARFLGLPEGCRIRERAKILAREKLVIGRNVWIGEGAVLDAQGGLTIGDYTQIGLNFLIWSHTSHIEARFGGRKSEMVSNTASGRKGIQYQSTKIGSHVFIAGPSVIAPGVTFGYRVIISPLSFVDRDLPDNAVFSPTRDLSILQAKVRKLEDALEILLEQGGLREPRSKESNDV